MPPGDLFALGSKSSHAGDVSFPKSASVPVGLGEKKISLLGDRKREPTTLLTSIVPAKKPKVLTAAQTFTPLGRPADKETDKRTSPLPPVSQLYEESAIEVDNTNLLAEVLTAEDTNDFERLEGLLCGAVKYLHSNRSKPDQIVFLTLMHLSKEKPTIFNSEIVLEALCSLLRRDQSLNFKSKGNSLVSVLICNVLMKAYGDEDNWPDDFVKVYIDDALGERVWVERPDCKGFVDNIVTAFHTNIPLGGIGSLECKLEQGSVSPAVSQGEDEDSRMDTDSSERSHSAVPEQFNVPIFPRYPYQIDNIETFVLEIVREQLIKRQLMDASAKSLIKLMTATCGYAEVRQLAAQKLELWLQNPKLARASQELLMSVCMNCMQDDVGDMEVIAMIIKMRMKTKPLINHYLLCIRELLRQHRDNLRMVLTHTIYNELSTTRNPNNMALIGVVFQTQADSAAEILAEIFQDLLTNKDDYLRALRALFREIVRSLRHDINFTAFCLALMKERTDSKFTDMEQILKERYMLSIADLVSMCVLQAITPAVREAVGAVSRGDKKDIEVLHNFQNLVATVQRDSLWWLHTVVPKLYEAKQQEYVYCMRKLLFMESPDQYAKDNWPAEADRGPMLRLATECPVLEDTLMRVLVIGLSKELTLGPPDAVEFADVLIKRAANLSAEGRHVIYVERFELFSVLLNLCTYRHPDNIALPSGYTPPTLAISTLYWKAWIILLIISAFNPSTFGLMAWETYPTLKCMIEMLMTNNYKFPPPTITVDDAVIEEIRNKEMQLAQREKQEILEFEGHLAASTTKVTITEANSLLISQLTLMDPTGTARKPPQQVMDQLRNLNDTLKIGQMLCRSRNPDFLLDIIQRQGTSQSMPWLAELVESSEGSLDMLPVQCLCEFLLQETLDTGKDTPDDETAKFERHKRKQKIRKQQQLLSRLQTMVHDPDAESSTTFEVMDYFLKRLASTQASNRALATKGLSMIISRSQLSPSEEPVAQLESEADATYTKHSWLLTHLPTLPLFPQVRLKMCSALRQAIQIECDPTLVSAYIGFLSQHTTDNTLQELDELALGMAQLILERTTILNYILTRKANSTSTFHLDNLEALIHLFVNYLRKAKEPNKSGYTWSNTQDQIMLQWETGESATMHILVVHAMIILLSYGPAHSQNLYKELLETWFPEKGTQPSAFLLDTSEEALLLPDWLKLRMIRSTAEPLVNAALQDLELSQLLIFVQSFGIPIPSMSKLLHCLDNAVTLDVGGVERSNWVEQSNLDKSYMAQFIEVQHMLGAHGGDKLYSLLTGGGKLGTTEDEDKMETQSENDALWKYQHHLDITMETVPASHVVNMLLQAFDMSGRRSPDTETHYRTLVMFVSKKNSGALDVAKGLNEILNGASGKDFSKSLMQSTKACSLLKIIISKQSESDVRNCVTSLMNTLSEFCGGQKSPLARLVNHYLMSHASRKVTEIKEIKTSNEEQFFHDLSSMSESESGHLETLIRATMCSVLHSQDTVSATKLACKALLMEDVDDVERCKILLSSSALFVDWLELLDPEVIRQVPDYQEKLLFARQQTLAQSNKGREYQANRRESSNQPYLLALLTHQSSWSTLHRCISSLLSEFNKGYDPVSVLDYLLACIHIPKIWHGRERRTPKNQSPEDVLGLKGSQLITLVDYIIQEATNLQNEATSLNNVSDKMTFVNKTPISISKRMDLLKSCLCGDKERVKGLVQYIKQKMSVKSESAQLYEEFLFELYLQYPYILVWFSDSVSFSSECHFTHTSQTKMDLISQRLITGMYQGHKGKLNDSRMANINLACRKLAAEHPMLVLRQLPAIVAMLKGKTQFTFSEFKQRNLLSLYSYILGLLELLQPKIFERVHSTLNDIIEEYFKLLSSYSGNSPKQMGSIIVKLVHLLNQYVTHDSQRATSLLQKHVVLLSNVSALHPDLSLLKSLLAGLTLPRHNKEDSTSTNNASGTVLYPVRDQSPWSNSYLMPLMQKMKTDNSEDLLIVLQELDEASKKKANILEHFVDDLKRVLFAKNDRCRNLAFDLVKRHITEHPKQAADFVAVFLHCLENCHPDIVMSALANLAEFTLLCQDYADVILQKALCTGITTSIETSSYISDSLRLLNLDLTSG